MTTLLAKIAPLSSSRTFCFRRFSALSTRASESRWTSFQRFGQRHLLSRQVPGDAVHKLTKFGVQANHSPSDGFCATEGVCEEQNEWYKTIEDSLWPGHFKSDTPWGFLLYRTSYANEEAWQRMVREIQAMVKPDPELPKQDIEDHVLARHNLHLMNDQAQFDGATSHELRDHFVSWVVDELSRRLHADEVERIDWDVLRRNQGYHDLAPCAIRSEVLCGLYGARYDFCLFVDDICLESLDHMRTPVVKILRRDWGHLAPEKRGYTVNPGFEDGHTAEPRENVGWMYIDVLSYMELYAYFSQDHNLWDSEYSRPPTMMWKSKMPGFWRT